MYLYVNTALFVFTVSSLGSSQNLCEEGRLRDERRQRASAWEAIADLECLVS